MLLSQTNSQDLGSTNDLTTLVTALPSQGILYPQEKREIFFRFSPRYTKSSRGWNAGDQPPPRKDYTLFMHIETVGSIAGISDKSSSGNGTGGKNHKILIVIRVLRITREERFLKSLGYTVIGFQQILRYFDITVLYILQTVH